MTHDDPSASRRTFFGLFLAAALGVLGWRMFGGSGAAAVAGTPAPLKLSDAEWRKRLSPEAYAVLRQAGTEAPFTSPLNGQHGKGTFSCAGCALPLSASSTKFDSGPAGPASPIICPMLSANAPTGRSAWRAPRCIVRAAPVTSAMSSMTVPGRPDCAIA